MSLSFVKSAVLSSTDGVSHNEETAIDTQETQSLRASAGSGAHQPLFEQLRANKEAADEKDEEFQRSLRGMRPLDEEDCAHLDAVDRMKEEKEYAVKSGIEREVALFRAAKEDRGLAQTVVEEQGKDGEKEEAPGRDAATKAVGEAAAAMKKKKEAKKIVPKFTIKKKRKRASQEPDSNVAPKKDAAKNDATSDSGMREGKKKEGGGADTAENGKGGSKSSPNATNESDSDDEGGGLLGLACYGSDSD